MNKRIAIALIASAVMVLGCTVGPRGQDGNPIPTGPNPSIEPDHPPVTSRPDLPKSLNLINLIVTATHGPIEITGNIAGERVNGPPLQPIEGRIGSGGGTWKGYVPYAPGTKVGVYLRAEYKGPDERVEYLRLSCEANEERVAPQIHWNLIGAKVVTCLWDAAH